LSEVRAITVLDPGPLTTVQDAGRPGLAHVGVPRSGWLDAPAAQLANRLVGNPPGAALLETTMGGVSLRVDAAMALAVTGAMADVRVAGRSAAWGEPLSLPADAEVVVGPARRGVRSYLAVAGGIDVPAVLGSRSADLLSGLGPAPLAAGQSLAVGPAGRPRPADVPPRSVPAGVLRLTEGPRTDWVVAALRRLTDRTWTVQAESNRVALRLTGQPLERAVPGELASEGIVLGAVQVPPDGQPLVFLADHPTTGGYPVVAVVDPADLWQCAQLRPGDTVRFTT
jgi:biotin-dependent carboxylase-like uncharacterized protein